MSTVEIDTDRHQQRVDDRARYDMALDRRIDELVDMLREGGGEMNCNRDEAAGRCSENEELMAHIVSLALNERGNHLEIEQFQRDLGRIRQIAYDEITGMCQAMARREIEREAKEAA